MDIMMHLLEVSDDLVKRATLSAGKKYSESPSNLGTLFNSGSNKSHNSTYAREIKNGTIESRPVLSDQHINRLKKQQIGFKKVSDKYYRQANYFGDALRNRENKVNEVRRAAGQAQHEIKMKKLIRTRNIKDGLIAGGALAAGVGGALLYKRMKDKNKKVQESASSCDFPTIAGPNSQDKRPIGSAKKAQNLKEMAKRRKKINLKQGD